MRRLLPRSPEPRVRAAAIHLEQAQYAAAARKLGEAIALSPGDPGLLQQRARVRCVEGESGLARRDIERACRLAPEDGALRQEWMRLTVIAGDHAAARRALSLGRLGPGASEFWRAYIACREGRFAESSERFGRAAGLLEGTDPAQRQKARLFSRIARVLGEGPAPSAPAGKELLIMGLGYRHPYQLSVDVIRSLRGCEAIYSNLSDPTVAEFLGLYPVPARGIVFRRADGQSTECARIVMAGLKTVRRAGVVTRGNPVYYGRLAYRLVTDCASRGYACRVLSSVSIGDFFPSLVDHARGEALGVQIRDSSGLDGLDKRLPLIIYNFTSGEGRRRLCRKLARLYPASHPCHLLAGSGALEYEPSAVTIAGLEPALMRADAAVTLLLPAAAPR